MNSLDGLVRLRPVGALQNLAKFTGGQHPATAHTFAVQAETGKVYCAKGHTLQITRKSRLAARDEPI